MPEEIDDQAAVRELMGEAQDSPSAAPIVEPMQSGAPEPAVSEAVEPAVAAAELQEPAAAGEPEPGAQPTHDELMTMLSQATPEERADILRQAQEAAIGNQVDEAIEPYRQQLQERIDAGTLDTETAQELLESRAQVLFERIQRESAQALAQETQRRASLDAFFSQVSSEFPGADVETLRMLSGQGIEPNALRTIAARQSQQAKKIEETAVAKYVAEKTKDGEVFVPASGNPSRPSGTKTLTEDSPYGDLLGL